MRVDLCFPVGYFDQDIKLEWKGNAENAVFFDNRNLTDKILSNWGWQIDTVAAEDTQTSSLLGTRVS